MSRGRGRGGGGGGSATLREVAKTLQLDRREIKDFTKIRREAMELYPPLIHQPLTLERTTDLGFMTDVKHELLQRFRESPFYHPKQGKRDIRRYMDSIRANQKESFEPIFERLPSELNWKKTLIDRKLAKKRKIDDEIVRKRLEQLSQREKEPQVDDTISDKEESDKEDDDAKKANEEDLEGQPISDEDYLEEDNDYVQNYFDNGDAYAEGSDDNLDEGYD